MNLLFEIGTEELPAGEIDGALQFMAEFVRARFDAARLAYGNVQTFATPRRLALLVTDLALAGETVEEEVIGPAARAAFAPDGSITRAAEGFARSRGIDPASLYRVETPKGEYVAARIVHAGEPAAAIAATTLGRLPAAIPWKRSMKWGWLTETFARPVHWMVALLGEQVLDVSFAGIVAGRSSRGHRFLHPGEFDVQSADSWLQQVRAAHVMADVQERRSVIADGVRTLCAERGWTALIDDELLAEVSHLVEWPFPLLGTFDEALLEVPREVLITSMKVHQRYFAVEAGPGQLAPAFAFVSNMKVRVPEVVIAGNRRVLLARLEDARFFYREDRRRTLSERVVDLERVVYMDRLGSIADRVKRLTVLAGALCDTLLPGDESVHEHATRAAALCKSDLVTGMVGEFPELQGIMGRYYALASDPPEPAEVADAIADHYRPRGASDAPASSNAARILALADKLEAIAGGFALGFAPTGSADPYALRRAAIGVIRTLLDAGWSLSPARAMELAWSTLPDDVKARAKATPEAATEFLTGRLQSLLASDYPVDVVDAVLAVVGDNLPAAPARCAALAQLRADAAFEPMAQLFKRAVNIVRKAEDENGWTASAHAVAPALFESPAESDLLSALEQADGAVSNALAAGDNLEAARALVALKPVVDGFFDQVMVNAPDPAVRNNRLLLLARTRLLFLQFADLSRIQISV